ncbi:hypothetical protein HGI47_04945 [Novosphingobium sp. ERN07]|uniref:hypothetical protein n=1 Tax=Novosphingobium sp. ERN07 TaxID=2726187 RepID=UPI001456B27D|nr:hypothetical protein [Novosphingobium sp. ERN07]NLR70219.1 hypothetical protein [Novosphingobium sp. ERN07]
MHVAAKPLEEVFVTLSGALDALDQHGEAMAALHLAMAVDCLRACLDAPQDDCGGRRRRPTLRLVASS